MSDLVQQIRDYLAARVSYRDNMEMPEYVRLMNKAADTLEALTSEMRDHKATAQAMHDAWKLAEIERDVCRAQIRSR